MRTKFSHQFLAQHVVHVRHAGLMVSALNTGLSGLRLSLNQDYCAVLQYEPKQNVNYMRHLQPHTSKRQKCRFSQEPVWHKKQPCGNTAVHLLCCFYNKQCIRCVPSFLINLWPSIVSYGSCMVA